MKEPFFWAASTLHYLSIGMASNFEEPVFTAVSLVTFFLIPSLTETEIMPGMNKTMDTQLEILKTQRENNENIQ